MEVKSIRGKLESNTFVVTHQNGTTLVVDAGATLEDLKRALDGKTPNAFFMTHTHFDHIFHVNDYRLAYPGVPIYASSRPATRQSWMPRVALPDDFIPIENNEPISIAGVSVRPLYAPGHSECSIVYVMGDALFSGDVLFSHSIGRTDFQPDGAAHMKQTLGMLSGVRFETAYHGHGVSSGYRQQRMNIAEHLEIL